MTPRLLAAVALASGSALLSQLALTRILSVVTWYHFSFAVISAALLGLGAGATAVSPLPRRFPRSALITMTRDDCIVTAFKGG